MLNLVWKDIVVQKRQFIFAGLYGIFILVVLSDQMFSNFVYSMGALGISYILILSIMSSEEKNNTDIVLNSLPLKRRDIVCSKYLSIIVSLGAGLFIMAAFGFLFQAFDLPIAPEPMRLGDVVISFCSIGLLSSVYFPIYYFTSGKWMRIANVLLFILVFFGPSWISAYLQDHADRAQVMDLMAFASRQPDLLYLAAAALVLLLMLISFGISLAVYQRKDF